MRIPCNAKPASERTASIETRELNVFHVPDLCLDTDLLGGTQRSVARHELGLAIPGSEQTRDTDFRNTA